MTTSHDRGSAEIYQFPLGGRFAIGSKRDDSKSVSGTCLAARADDRIRRQLVSRGSNSGGRTRPQELAPAFASRHKLAEFKFSTERALREERP